MESKLTQRLINYGNNDILKSDFKKSISRYNNSPNSMKIASEPRLKKRYAVVFATLFFACLVSMYDGSLNTVPSEFIYFDF